MAGYRFAVLGDPIDHSRSPKIHRVLLRLAGLEGEYLAVRADEYRLRSEIAALRSGRWNGLNITMPLKTAAVERADSLSGPASRAGSVNTLCREGGAVVGHSTDSSAMSELLGDDRFAGTGSILVLGAGGSAAAVLAALNRRPHVYVSSRRPSQAEELTRRLGGKVQEWEAAVDGSLVVNTTPLGMAGDALPEPVLKGARGLIDLPYGAEPTPAVLDCQQMGIPVADGHEFLLRQAIESFSLWTGAHLEFEVVSSELRKV